MPVPSHAEIPYGIHTRFELVLLPTEGSRATYTSVSYEGLSNIYRRKPNNGSLAGYLLFLRLSDSAIEDGDNLFQRRFLVIVIIHNIIIDLVPELFRNATIE